MEIGLRKAGENTIGFFALQGTETVRIPRISVIGFEQRYGCPVLVVDVDFEIRYFAGQCELVLKSGQLPRPQGAGLVKKDIEASVCTSQVQVDQRA